VYDHASVVKVLNGLWAECLRSNLLTLGQMMTCVAVTKK